MTILSPCWAYFVSRIRSSSRLLYLAGCSAIFTATVYFAYYPTRVDGVSYYLTYYGLFCLIGILAYGLRFSYTEFFQVLAFTVITLFIAGDLWEIPEFICDFLFRHNGAIESVWLASQIRRVYTLAVAVLFQRLTGFRFNRTNVAIFAAALVLNFILLLPPDNMKLLTGWPLVIVSRTVFTPCFIFACFLGVPDA